MAIYDVSLYDNDVYDDPDVENVAAVVTFRWSLEAAPQEEEVKSFFDYELDIQGTDADNNVRTQAVVEASIELPESVMGDEIYPVAGSTVDLPLHILSDDGVDLLVLISLDNEFTVKFNSVTGTSFTLRAKGTIFMDVKNVTDVFVSNSGTSLANIRFIQARRQVVV